MKVGYTLDEKGNVKEISSLYAAAQWFKKKFIESNMDANKISKIEFSGQIKGDFIKDYTNPVLEGDTTKFTICWIMSVTFNSIFGIPDKRYYYIIFRKNWFNRWANTYFDSANKYFNQDGITIKMDILNHCWHLIRQDISALVLVTGDTNIYYMTMADAIKTFRKLGAVTDKYNQNITGLPKSTFKLNEDVFTY